MAQRSVGERREPVFAPTQESERVKWLIYARACPRTVRMCNKLNSSKGSMPHHLDTILNLATPRCVPRGATLFKQGDKPCWLTLITAGRLKIGLVAPDGRTLAVGFLGPGEIAGCAAVFQRVPYPATAKAVEDSAVLTWTMSEIEALVERYPKMAANAVRVVGARADAMLRRLQQLSTENVEQRIARALLRLASEAGRLVKGGVQVNFALSRQDLAELSGATVYTVSRTLNV